VSGKIRHETTTKEHGAAPPRPATAITSPPTRIGHYRIVRELGRGGMGVVYEAEHEVLGRRVALKTLLPGTDDADRQARILDEARTAGRLRHPAIVDVIDAGESDGHVFLVMTLIRGDTLEARLDDARRLAPGEACALLLPVADALAHAHRERVVHRDVKPGNVLIDASGRPLLADFGLACDLFAGRERSPAERPMGTACYMAPEQLRGEQVGPAADVWAFGVTLYECLTGGLPWNVDDDLEALARAQEGDPAPPRALAPAVSPQLEQVVLRCLARRPEDRFADGAALVAALEAARRAGLEVKPGVARLRARLVAAVGLVAGLVAGASAAQMVTRIVSGETAGHAPPAVDVTPT
jgi:serine/threonine-protein kinase